MKHVVNKPGVWRWHGLDYIIQGDRLVCRTSGDHPPTPPGYRLERTVGKRLRGVITCFIVTFKRSRRVNTSRPPRLTAAAVSQLRDAPLSQLEPLSHATDGLYSQVPPELWPEVDHA